MKTRRAGLILVALASMAQAPTSPDWREWRYTRTVDAPPVAQTTVVAIDLPAPVAARSAGQFADLRVVDQAGREVPYLMDPGGVRGPAWRTVRLFEPSTTEEGFSQVLLDAGEQDREHNSLTLDIERTTDFMTWIQIAVSDDARSWRIVRDRAPYFDLSGQQPGAKSSRVIYPDTRARFVRLRWLDSSRTYNVLRAQIAERQRVETPREDAGVELTSTAPAGGSTWTSAARESAVPVSAVAFDTGAQTFYRPVVVHTSEDGERWSRVGSGDIYRLMGEGTSHESLVIDFPETWARHWRVTVLDRDERPIADLRPRLQARRHRLVFQQEPGATYRLLYGHPRARAPEYFLARVINASAVDAAVSVTVGPETSTPEFVDPAPWTERHPVVMWVALGLAVLAIGGLAVRSLRRDAKGGPGL